MISKKNAGSAIRTRNIFVEAHKDLNYAMKSLGASQINKLKFLGITDIVFFIYKLTLSRKLKIRKNNFPIDLDRKTKSISIWDFTERSW